MSSEWTFGENRKERKANREARYHLKNLEVFSRWNGDAINIRQNLKSVKIKVKWS